MWNSYDVIEIDNYVILNTLPNFHFQEYSIFVYQFELKTCLTKYRQNIKDRYFFITKYFNLYWIIEKKNIEKKIDFEK